MKPTHRSTGASNTTMPQPVIALAGNPNTGKSTVFNALTGLKQHTGNWPGKTVLQTKGSLVYAGCKYTLVDLPGTYSLLAGSLDEQVARDFICFAKPDATVIVVDATCLERNLNLALQIMEITSQVILCINLIDEARRKRVYIDQSKLEQVLGVPVVKTAASSREGLPELLKIMHAVVSGHIKPNPKVIRYEPAIEIAISQLEAKIKSLIGDKINPRWAALRLLEGDTSINELLKRCLHELPAIPGKPVPRSKKTRRCTAN